MPLPEPGTDAWLDQVGEDIIDPERPIIDPHHHLWKKRFGRNYLLPELWSDTGGGHNVQKTLFMECRAFYLREGPDYLRPLGETTYIAELARQSEQVEDQATVAGIIAHADLTLAGANEYQLIELLDKHKAICGGRFRGIRHAAARDNHPKDLFIAGNAPPNLYSQESFCKGLRLLGARNLTFDAWHYHHQNRDFLDLARDVPECTLVLDHFGTPLGVGIYQNCRENIFQQWKQDMADLAKCSNVYAKLGGLAMPDNGFGWDQACRPPNSDEFVRRQKQFYLHMIDCFGPERCMFESNFPVDRLSINYPALWNGFKKMTADFTEEEKHALFYGTAQKVYSV
ncbi:MAG: amidohydrolase family protein [Gammaproteobacteria bacterium]|nr:amidohydrolase family protein [Gammaproteobacteria bacterium]